jgi:hypothetical protein
MAVCRFLPGTGNAVEKQPAEPEDGPYLLIKGHDIVKHNREYS